MEPATNDERARRGARRCVPPLGLLAVAFVLPTVHSCVGSISPLSFGVAFPDCAAIIWPVFLLAAALAAMTLVRRADPEHADRPRAVLAVPVLTWAASLWLAVRGGGASAWVAKTDDLIAIAGVLVALPLSIGAFARALRAGGMRSPRSPRRPGCWSHRNTSSRASSTEVSAGSRTAPMRSPPRCSGCPPRSFIAGEGRRLASRT